MRKWDYDLKSYGKNLRDYIQEGDTSKEHCETILDQIICCCNYLMKNLTNEDKEWYEMDLEEFIEDCDDARYYLEEDDEELNQDEVNNILERFYDLMDTMRVWVAL